MIEGHNNRMDCRFNYDGERSLVNSSSPLYKGTLVMDDPELSDFSITFLSKKFVMMNKQQWAIGFSILELSKLIMQRLYYQRIQPTFGAENVELLMTDTDSFLMRIKSVDPITEDQCMEKLADVTDFSNYPKNHPLYNAARAKQVGLLKNELPNKKIETFVGLKSKTYAIRVEGASSDEIKAKGVPKSVRNSLKGEHMLECLKQVKRHSVTYQALRSRKHVMELIRSDRVAFSSFDDKR